MKEGQFFDKLFLHRTPILTLIYVLIHATAVETRTFSNNTNLYGNHCWYSNSQGSIQTKLMSNVKI